ncbi:MAG: thiamine diphosphokinase [Spirochaetes bacterium]|nr:thiamine diphosphokinase [Spirochaetota bacterium]
MLVKKLSYLISANGSITDYSEIRRKIPSFNRCISVDGGIRHLAEMEIIPDVAIGDFDSLGGYDLRSFPDKTEIIQYPVEKNSTDMELALDYAINNNADSITVIGYNGTRTDHFLCNIFLLSKIPSGICVRLIDEKNFIYLADKEITLKSDKNSYISVLPLTPEVGIIKSEGLLYDLTGLKLSFGSSLSISNKTVSDSFSISIESGKALILISQD